MALLSTLPYLYSPLTVAEQLWIIHGENNPYYGNCILYWSLVPSAAPLSDLALLPLKHPPEQAKTSVSVTF